MSIETTQKEQAERLDRLIDYLEELNDKEPARFSLSKWAQSQSPEELEKAHKEWPSRYQAGEPLNCNTSACVVGHLVVAFPAEFLWIIPGGETTAAIVNKQHEPGAGFVGGATLADFFGGNYTDWDATIYGNGYDDTERDEHGQVRLISVIRRLRALRILWHGERLHNE
jgi:hypothetical protein